MKKISVPIVLVFLAFTLGSWGVVGHRASGKIAENHLSQKAKKQVESLLGTESLAMVSTYPDEIRSYEEYKYTSPWHYVNLPQGLTFEQFSTQLKALEKANIYKALLDCSNILKDPAKSKADQVFALKFIVHMVGDLHQPMHTGRSEDSGGNDIKVNLMRKETNLHGLWDSGLIDYAGMSFTELADACDILNKKEIKQFQKDDIVVWAFESYQISQQLYKEAAEDHMFDYKYYPRHADVVKRRLAQAGVRLAGLLNTIYK